MKYVGALILIIGAVPTVWLYDNGFEFASYIVGLATFFIAIKVAGSDD